MRMPLEEQPTLIENFDNLKKIFNSYKSGKQFIDDFNMIPITATNNNSDSILV